MLPSPDGRETILLVEDDERLREGARRTLAEHGYTVLTAEDGVAALACYHGHAGRVDLVIADLVMPRMHGPQLFEALHAEAGTVKFLFTSGYGGGAARRLLWSDIPFLQKPWDGDDLLRAVRRVLDG